MSIEPSGTICTKCLDVVFYCTCFMGEDRALSNSGEFTITSGKSKVTWSPTNRMLSGNQKMIDEILSELSGEKETICDVGTLWMEQREPVAVAFVAENLGFELSGDVPEWGFRRD